MIKRYQRELLYLVLIAVVAFVATCLWTHALDASRASQALSVHDWLHSKMALTPVQERALAQVEARFGVEQQRLQGAIAQAKQDLAGALTNEPGYTPRVAAAVEAIHGAQGDLQKSTLQHIFAMREVLTPEQARAEPICRRCPQPQPMTRSRCRRRSRHRFSVIWNNQVLKRKAVSVSVSSEAILGARQELRTLLAHIERLPASLREAFILYAIEERPQNECEQLLKISAKAVETRVYRARRELAKSLFQSQSGSAKL